jgi:hypothetical protein
MKTIFVLNGVTYYIQKGNYFMKDSTSISQISNDDYEIAWNAYNITLISPEPIIKLVEDVAAIQEDIGPMKEDISTLETDNSTNKTDISNIKTNGIIGETQYGGAISTNLNTINKDGFYTCNGTATGVPSDSYSWYVLHQNSNVGTTNATQTAIAYDTTLIMYTRNKVTSTWGAWFKTTLSEFNINDYIQSGVTSALGSMSLTGNKFSMCGMVTLTAALETQTSKLILTLPVGCRPKTSIDSPATIFSASSCQPAFINISTAGEVTIFNRTTDETCVFVTLDVNYVIGD